ncbi:sigma-54 dependent transcriptional regulator [Thiolapillus sp.]
MDDTLEHASSKKENKPVMENAFHDCIIAYDPERKHGANLDAIVKFLGHDLSIAFDMGELEKQLQQYPELLTVIVAGNLSENEQQKVMELLSDEAPKVLPIVLYESPGADDEPLVLRYPSNWAALELPLTHAEFSSALRRVQSHAEGQQRGKGRRPTHLFRSLIGRSPAIQRIRQEIEQAGPTDANVLILGESGTGKEVVARNLHYYSKRWGKAFVPINCGAIPKDLLESELFGHEKGAFTGALTAREGRFSMAAGGTLFLDEIGEMPMDMQVKLLRVLEERVFERVGGNKPIKADVRIVAATNCNLEQMVADGNFRGDLFYRLEVFPIYLPKLSERIEDLPLLISQLNERLQYEKQCSVEFSPDAIQALSRYHWPGNVRELANLIERLSIQHPNGLVRARDLPAKYRPEMLGHEHDDQQLEFFSEADVDVQPQVDASGTSFYLPKISPDGLDMKSYVSEIEKKLISQALEETGGVIAHAAKLLGLRRTTLTEKMRKYGLQRPKAAADKGDA